MIQMIKPLFQSVRDLLKRNRFRIKGQGNILDIAPDSRKTLSKVTIKMNGKNNRVIIGMNTLVSNTEIRIDGENNLIRIGENGYFRSGKIYLRKGQDKHVTIGDETTVENAYLLTDEQADIDIGKDCMFSAGIMIRTGDKHSIMDCNTHKRVNHAKSIIIHDRVWVGRDVLILKGSEVKRGSIIGAKSLITSKFSQPNVVIAGSPGKIVKKEIYWDRKLLK